jgi:hypothetical protein
MMMIFFKEMEEDLALNIVLPTKGYSIQQSGWQSRVKEQEARLASRLCMSMKEKYS